MQFFTIVQFILDQPNTLAEGKLLSEREEVLLKMAASIRHCPGGKKEGIAKAYNIIKGQAATGLSSEGSQLHGYFDTVMQNEFSAFLSNDNAFIREVTQVPADKEIKQLVHQSIYLKNLIGKPIGLIWDLTMDQHTYIIYDDLVNLERKEVLESFFRYFTPDVLIEVVQKTLKKDHTEGKQETLKDEMYHRLSTFLGGYNPEHWDITELNDDEKEKLGLPKDDEVQRLSLTRKGVIALLEKLGYLEARPSASAAP
jgi:hypothetical protein